VSEHSEEEYVQKVLYQNAPLKRDPVLCNTRIASLADETHHAAQVDVIEISNLPCRAEYSVRERTNILGLNNK